MARMVALQTNAGGVGVEYATHSGGRQSLNRLAFGATTHCLTSC
jgi:hypothetical protein